MGYSLVYVELTVSVTDAAPGSNNSAQSVLGVPVFVGATYYGDGYADEYYYLSLSLSATQGLSVPFAAYSGHTAPTDSSPKETWYVDATITNVSLTVPSDYQQNSDSTIYVGYKPAPTDPAASNFVTVPVFNSTNNFGTTSEQWINSSIMYDPKVWIAIDVPINSQLFTTGADTVNFNSLTSAQQSAVAGGADLYHGLGGGDTITLPDANPTDTSITLPGTTTQYDLTKTFVVGDKAGDTTSVTGGSGSYNITLGAGTDAVTINGAGTTHVSAGSGADTLSISGGGTLVVNGSLGGGSVTIGANSTFEPSADESANGTFNLDAGGTINLAGHQLTLSGVTTLEGTVTGPGTLVVTGPLAVSDTFDVEGDAIVDLSESSSSSPFSGSITVGNGDFLNVTDATVSGNGSIDFTGDALSLASLSDTPVSDSLTTILSGIGSAIVKGGADLVLAAGSSVSGSTFTIGSGSSIELTGNDITSTNTVIFDPTGPGTLDIHGTIMPTALIRGFLPSTVSPPATTGAAYHADTIDLVDVPYDSKGFATFNPGGNSVQPNGVLQIHENGSTYTLQLDPAQNYKGDVFPLSDDGNGGTDVQVLAKANAGIDAATNPGVTAMAWLWANTNLSWVGYYLEGAPNLYHSTSGWEGTRGVLSSQGWAIAPIWVGYQDPGTASQNDVPILPSEAGSLGATDGTLAVQALKADGFSPGSVAYLDIETSVASPQEEAYAQSWASTLATAGYGAGIYCPSAAAGAYHILLPNAPIWVAKYYPPSSSPAVQNNTNILPSYDPTTQYPSASAWQYQQGLDNNHPNGWSIDVGSKTWGFDLDSGKPVTTLPVRTFLGKAQDGYLSGATVFADANGTGQPATNDVSTTTDSTGSFSLTGGSGPLIAFGGTDTSTGLPFNGRLSGPAGSTDITPLTTLLTNLTSDSLAQTKVLSALGLSSTLDLTTFDPIAAAQGGSADGAATEIAGAKVYDTVEMIASALAGAGGSFMLSLQAAFSALASSLDGAGLNLADKVALSALVTQVALTENVALGSGVADAIASVIAGGNAALDHVLQTEQPGSQLLTDAASIELVEQGVASNAITNAAGNLVQLQNVENLFTGANLGSLVSQGFLTTSAAIAGIEGTAISTTIASITDAKPNATAGDFTATINWGDGTTTTGTVVAQNGGGFAVNGTHTYAEEGNYQPVVTVTDAGGSSSSATSTATIADAPITASAASISGVEGTQVTAVVATFTDSNPSAPLGDFTATINWGDGTTSTGTVVAQSGGGFAVNGTHTYAEEGNYQTVITVTDVGGSTETANSSAAIADAPLTATPGIISGTEGAAINATVATFTDANPNATAGDFSATINWGDNVTTLGTVVLQKDGTFAITGTHTYAEEGHYQTVVTVNDIGGSTTSATSAATIADAPLSAIPGSITGTESKALTATVATFTDASTNAPVSDFAATINWGDNTTTTGTVVLQKDGSFAVTGTHTYAEEGDYQTVVTVNDVGGSATTAVGTATVVDPPLVANPDSNGVAKGHTIYETAAHGVLANDSDPDDLTVEAVDGRSCAVGHAIEGKYGSLTLNADGSYTYRASHDHDGWDFDRDGWDFGHGNGVAEDSFKYTVSDGHGGMATSTLTFVVFDQGTTYLSGANTTLNAGKGPYVLDGSAGGDTLKAGTGNDVLIGGNGDALFAGHGQDTFLFRPNFGSNTISNFNVHDDTLQFDHGIFSSFHDIVAHTTDTASGAVISDGHGDTITLLGITKVQLHMHEQDFHLA